MVQVQRYGDRVVVPLEGGGFVSWVDPTAVAPGRYWCPACRDGVDAEEVRREWGRWTHEAEEGEHEVYPALLP